MSDIIIYTTLASSILVILFILSLVLKRKRDNSQDENERPAGIARREPAAQVRRVGGRVVRSRLQRARQVRELEVDDEDEALGDDDGSDMEEESASPLVLPEGKIGAKKRKKLEMKAEKRAQREQELQEREHRKQQQAALEEQRKTEEERQRLEEQKQKEEEQRLKEEKARQEHEEYLNMKESFQVEEEGFDEEGVEEGQDLYKDFIDYIISQKVVQLEDLAVQFKLKTQDAIDRLNSVLSSGDLTGVIDDRGKFIYISRAELEAVAKFIRQRGRVTISELAESSNLLINMNPNAPVVKSAA